MTRPGGSPPGCSIPCPRPRPERPMLKKLFATGILMAFLGGVVVAADFDGVIMKIDTEKKTIKAKVKIKEEYVEKDFTYTDDTTFKGKVGKKGSKMPLSADAISTALGTKR